jgi:hypothetical protein
MNSNVLTNLVLIHKSGEHLFPCKLKNRKTKNVAYNLYKKGNLKKDCIETLDEQKVIDLVVNHNYGVRSRSLNANSRHGIFRTEQRSITNFQIRNS